MPFAPQLENIKAFSKDVLDMMPKLFDVEANKPQKQYSAFILSLKAGNNFSKFSSKISYFFPLEFFKRECVDK